eukprot:TRINITY_DN5561_c0_g1_i1.p1 TRINITY_DN5561_c0_g1~~TRINITY_DN5561_c0_g1_i1.p1  ORF type:complete len:205 (+),score=35.31 TRINITY_DN5561_c0_g1_i1:53-667(+)
MLECALVTGVAGICLLWWLGGEEASDIKKEENFTVKRRVGYEEKMQETRKAMTQLVESPAYQRWRFNKVEEGIENEIARKEQRTWIRVRLVLTIVAVGAYSLFMFPFPEESTWATPLGFALLLTLLACCDSPSHASLYAACVTCHMILATPEAPFPTGYFFWLVLLICSAFANSHIKQLKASQSINMHISRYENLEYDAVLADD